MLPRKHSASMALAVLCGVVLSLPIHAVEVESHNIPPHLTDCYRNESLYHRENRLPSSMAMVVALLRQIEESPGFTMDIRSFALSLLHMFRVDGVERNPEVVASEHTIPFGLTGTQYYKFNLLVNGLIPRSSFLFPNETLNDVEKCSLHFMMSDSLDRYKREDEYDSPCPAAPYRGSAANQRRARRSLLDADDEVESVPQSEGDSAPAPNDHDSSAPHVDATGPAPDNPDAEIVDEQLPLAPQNERKGDLMWNQDGANPPTRGSMRSAPGAAPGVGGPGGARSSRTQVEESACPVENGVVWARWGSVQLGAVLAGIATGFETQLVQIKDLRKSSSSKFTDPKVVSGTIEIDNRYAATLAADVAEVALWNGPKGGITVGASGNWNNTQVPRWYFISKASEMTDAEVRGGLDGLIMAHHVKEWKSKANGNLKLSTVLERYYSTRGVFDKDYRACERQSHYKDVAKKDVISTQSKNFGYLLYDSTPGLPTISFEGVAEYVSQALEVLDRTIRESSQLEATCENLGRSSDDVESLSKSDIVFIVDCSWSVKQINGMFQSLVNYYNGFLHPYRNTLTAYGANKDFPLIFQSANRSNGFAQNLQQNRSVYEQCRPGVDMEALLDDHLRNLYYTQLTEEKEEEEPTLHSKVVVIMPYSNYDLQERNKVQLLVNEYRRSFPDVKFLVFASNSKKDIFQTLVENSETDIIEFQANDDIDIDGLVRRLNSVHQRIANPTCGGMWRGRDYTSGPIYDIIPLNSRVYYRIHSRYLFGAGSVTVKVGEENKGTVKVCHSRDYQFPNDDDSNEDRGEGTCSDASNSNVVTIELDKPCGSHKDYLSCSSLYLSVEATESKNNCNEKMCLDADDILIKLEVKGLTCGASALASPLVLIVAITAILKLLISS